MIPLPPGPFDILYVDPPWDYDNRVQKGGSDAAYDSGAEAYYPTLTYPELAAMAPAVKAVYAKDALCYMWTTGPQMHVAIALLYDWGFDYRTVAFVWDKQRVNPGYYTMSQCEYVLVGTKGRIPTPRGARNARQFLSEARTEHSRKPAEIRARIEAMHPEQNKLEMFARGRYPGWTVWGNDPRCVVDGVMEDV